MAIDFIPTIWSARLLAALRPLLVYAQPAVVNKDYEGEITKAGNTVKIGQIGDVSIGDYVKNTDIADPETLTDEEQSLLIDNAKYFAFQVDDIDKAQANVNFVDEAMTRAAWSLQSALDSLTAATMDAAVPGGNKIGSVGTPIVPTKDDAYEYLVDLGTLLDESNTPQEGRFCVVPPWFHGLLQKDARFVAAGTTATDQVLRNGTVGQAAGMSIFKSNAVPNTAGAKYKIIAGHRIATTVAEQITAIEKYRLEKRFADAVKGLHVYGVKVTRGACLAEIIANKA